MDQEITFYQDASGVLITDRRAVFKSGAYDIRNVASVTMGKKPADQKQPLIILGLGLLMLFFGASSPAIGVLGLLLASTGAVMRFMARDRYVVEFSYDGRDVEALLARDAIYASGIVAALNQALRSRPPQE